MSFHLPEKGAIRGVDHRPPSKDEVIIVEDERLPRVKKSVFPFAEKVGERSSAGPEMIPGANSFGLFALCAAHSGEFAPKRARSPTRQFMYIRFLIRILLTASSLTACLPTKRCDTGNKSTGYRRLSRFTEFHGL